ncbi:hypothetical protein ACFX13_000085 [Malus domestica]
MVSKVVVVQMAFDRAQEVAVYIHRVVEFEVPSTSYLDDLSSPDCRCWRMGHSLVDFGLDNLWHWHFPIPHSLSIEDIDQWGVLP